MLCDNCKKREANFHYTKLVNGNKEELHLCDTCAYDSQEFDINTPLSIGKLFSGFFANKKEEEGESLKDITCSNCGLTFSKFQKTGKLGCFKCYKEFDEYLQPIIKGIHGHNRHRGKTPKRIGPDVELQREIDELTRKLEELIKKEEFEQAAVIRDEIKKIKSELHEGEE